MLIFLKMMCILWFLKSFYNRKLNIFEVRKYGQSMAKIWPKHGLAYVLYLDHILAFVKQV